MGLQAPPASPEGVVTLQVGLPGDTSRLEDVDQAVLGGIVVTVIEDISGSGASNHGDVVGLGRMSGT